MQGLPVLSDAATARPLGWSSGSPALPPSAPLPASPWPYPTGPCAADPIKEVLLHSIVCCTLSWMLLSRAMCSSRQLNCCDSRGLFSRRHWLQDMWKRIQLWQSCASAMHSPIILFVFQKLFYSVVNGKGFLKTRRNTYVCCTELGWSQPKQRTRHWGPAAIHKTVWDVQLIHIPPGLITGKKMSYSIIF